MIGKPSLLKWLRNLTGKQYFCSLHLFIYFYCSFLGKQWLLMTIWQDYFVCRLVPVLQPIVLLLLLLCYAVCRIIWCVLLIYTVPNVLCLMYAMYCWYWVVGDPVLYGAVIDASLCCGLLYSLILQYNKCSSAC